MLSRSPSIRCVADCKAILGEGPVWVVREQALYWVDIKGSRLFRLSEHGGVTSWDMPEPVCSLAPRAAGGFIAGTRRGFAFVEPENGLFERLGDLEAHLPRNRMNDGKVDRQGRFWAGTMDDAEEEATGSLYRLHADLNPHRIDEGYLVTNGPAFSPDGRILYHTDSARRTIYAFDLDEHGEVANKRVLARFGEEHGHPDGMTVDAEGAIWAGFWDGWCVRRLSSDGEMLRTLRLPVQRPTSCAFGGKDLDRLYVTSARIGLDERALEDQPCAGGLLLIEGVGRGLPERPFAG
ncbi:MAG TPA: SMP-30/gluconolactonase/LRE family protein [Allosphingosinicella sp.]